MRNYYKIPKKKKEPNSKLYKARKKCIKCRKIFYAEYKGRIYCYKCKPKYNEKC